MENTSLQDTQIRDFLLALSRRWWVVAGLCVSFLLAAVAITHWMPRIYEAHSQIEIKAPPASLNGLASAVQLAPDTFQHTQVLLLTNPWMMDHISQNLRRKQGVYIPPASVAGGIAAKETPSSALVDIYARHRDPHIAQMIANEAALSFREYLAQVNADAAEGALGTMRSRVSQSRDAMEQSSQRLASFETRYHIIDLPEQTKDQITQLSSTGLAAAQVQRDLDAAETSVSALEAQLTRQNSLIRAGGVRSDAVVDQLRTHLSEQRARLRLVEQAYVDSTQAAAPLRADIAATERALNAEVAKATRGMGNLAMQQDLLSELQKARREAAALRSQYDLIRRQLVDARAGTRDLPSLERMYTQLSQNAEVDRDLYQKTLEAFGQIDMERLSQPSIVEITGLAHLPTAPVSPQLRLNLAAALITALVLSFLLIVLLERLDDTVTGESDLQRLLPELPVLGSLPKLSNSDRGGALAVLSAQNTGPYRLLWTSIGFAGVDNPIRSLLVTSSSEGEGKSLTCAQIARAAAEEGKKVILVDCDLRRPTQARMFAAVGSPGLCEVLAGKTTLEDALIPTDQPDLQLLTAGQSLPLNPAVLIKSEKMSQLLSALTARADLVLLDAPPVMGISDPLLLATRCQAVIQIVEVGGARRHHVAKVVEMLQRARASHLGLVLNKVRSGGLGGYYVAYRYHHYSNGKTAPGIAAEGSTAQSNGARSNGHS